MDKQPLLSIQGIKGAVKKGLINLKKAQEENKKKTLKVAKEQKAFKQILDSKMRTVRRQSYAKEVLKQEKLKAQLQAKFKYKKKKNTSSFNGNAVVSKEMWDL